MKIRTLLTALALALLGCDDSASERKPDPSVETAPTGTLSLKLVSADSGGRYYRLRNASFYVQGFWSDVPFPGPDAGALFSTTLSSESDPDAPVLSVKLTPGYYDVRLANDDWYLERRTQGVWQRVEQAVLLSAKAQGAYVADRSVSTVNFRFGVDGELIDFRSGDLLIGVTIERPGEGDGDGGVTGGLGGTTGGYFGGGTAAAGGNGAAAPF